MYIAKLSTVHKMNEIATETGLRIQRVLKVYMEEVCCFIYNFKNYSFISDSPIFSKTMRLELDFTSQREVYFLYIFPLNCKQWEDNIPDD